MTMTPAVLATRDTGVMDQHQDHEHDPAAKPRRRTFTAEKKLALLAEYAAADRDGKGALLRREAIYSSHTSEWRKQRDRGMLTASAARKRKSAEQVKLREDAGLEEHLDQRQDPFVSDPSTHPAHQGRVVDGVEGLPDSLPVSRTFRRPCEPPRGACMPPRPRLSC
jgi:transposase-like protein